MREWLTELTKALFSEETGLFILKKGVDDASYFLNPKAKTIYKDNEYKDYFSLAGLILAKAVFERIPIAAHLNKSLISRLVMAK